MFVFVAGCIGRPFVSAPTSTDCKVATTRCQNNEVQVCDTGYQWDSIMLCEDLGSSDPLVCVEVSPGEHGCVPKSELDAGGQ
jgi:hypothetical protein